MAFQTGPDNDLAPEACEVFNAEEAMDLVGGDQALFQELVGVFLDDCPRQLASIREAIARESPLDLQRSAHHLKGSVCAFGSGAAVNLAVQLEEIGRRGDIGVAPAKFTELEETIARLNAALLSFERTGREG